MSAPGELESRHHHGSHRHLISKAAGAAVDVDAIIVPTSRNAVAMRPTIELASKLNCTLLALCSKASSVAQVRSMAGRHGVDLIAVDIDRPLPGLLPSFATCELLAGTPFERRSDTSAKRNLGLLLARVLRWERVVFLDDDIEVPDPVDLLDAAGLTDSHAGVGLDIDGFPDNSVVCHAYREAGGRQEMFIGGGALAVGARFMDTFFPNIYNEDWFFLLGEDEIRPVTVTGRVRQKPYDPFAHELRARLEELGDCLAEGLYWLLDSGKSLRDATVTYWRGALDRRLSFINEVIAMVEAVPRDPAEKKRMLSSLKAARGRCLTIDPELCVAYVAAWQADRVRWRDHLDRLCRQHAVRDLGRKERRRALSALGLGATTKRLELPAEPFGEDAADLRSPAASLVRW